MKAPHPKQALPVIARESVPATGTPRRFGVLGLVETASLSCGLLMQIAVARGLNPADYGRFAALSVIELGLLILVAGGIPQALHHLVSRNLDNLPEALRWVVRVQLPLSTGVALILSTGAPLIGQLVGDRDAETPLRILSLAVFLRCGVLEPCSLLLNGAQCYVSQAVIATTYHLLRLICVVILVALTGDLRGAVAGLAVAAMLAAAPAALFVRSLGKRAADVPDASFGSLVRAWAGLCPGYELLAFLLAASNLWVVKVFVPDPALAGLYAACFMVTRASSALSRAVSGSTIAPLTFAFSRGRTESPRRIIAGSMRAFSLLLTPSAACALVCGEDVVRFLYGPGYAGSGLLVGMLFLGSCGFVVLSFCGGVLGAAGRLRPRLHTVIVLGLVSLPASIALVRFAGLAGAAWALLVTGGAGATMMCWLVRSLVGPFMPWPSVLRASVASLPLVAVGTWGELATFSTLFIGALGYGGMLVLLGEWNGRKGESLHPAIGVSALPPSENAEAGGI